MIFCPTPIKGRCTATQLGCFCLCEDMEDEEREEILTRWLQCELTERDNMKRILVDATGIGTGLNQRNVVLVIHLGAPQDLVSYAQETGLVDGGSRMYSRSDAYC